MSLLLLMELFLFSGTGAAGCRSCAESTRRFRDGKEDGISRSIGAAYTGKRRKRESEAIYRVDIVPVGRAQAVTN
jgi:hypothetical protein